MYSDFSRFIAALFADEQVSVVYFVPFQSTSALPLHKELTGRHPACTITAEWEDAKCRGESMDNSDLLRSLESLLGPALEDPDEGGEAFSVSGSAESGYDTSLASPKGTAGTALASEPDAPTAGAKTSAPATLPLPGVTGQLTPPPSFAGGVFVPGERIPVPGVYPSGPTDEMGHAEDILSLLSAAVPVGVGLLDAQSRVVLRANSLFYTMLHVAATGGGVVRQPLAALVPDFAGSDIDVALAGVLRTGVASMSLVEDVSDGDPYAVAYRRCSLIPMRDARGAITRILLAMMDVTEQVQARRQVEHLAARAEALEGAVLLRAGVARSLLRGLPLPEMLAQVAEQIGSSIGDGCGIFLLDQQAHLWPWALYHRDPLRAVQLRSAYAQRPLEVGEGLAGRVARDGVSVLRVIPRAGSVSEVAPPPDPLGQMLGIHAVACVPLGDAAETLGAVVVLSSRRAAGGTEHTISSDDLGVLHELTGEVALAVQHARLRHALESAQSQQHAMLDLLPDGVAVYDAYGNLRSINGAASRLLAHPEGASLPTTRAEAATRWLTPEGRPVLESELPWRQALSRPQEQKMPLRLLVLSWQDGARRDLLVRAAAVRDADGEVTSVVVLLRPTEAGVGPVSGSRGEGASRSRTTARLVDSDRRPETADASAVCARVARARGSAYRRRLEVHMPPQPVPLAYPEELVERVVVALLDIASSTFPAGVPLALNTWVDVPGASSQLMAAETTRKLSVPQVRAQLRPPSSIGTAPLGPGVVFHVCAIDPIVDVVADEPALAHVRFLAAALTGEAWTQTDDRFGTGYFARIPLTIAPSRLPEHA